MPASGANVLCGGGNQAVVHINGRSCSTTYVPVSDGHHTTNDERDHHMTKGITT